MIALGLYFRSPARYVLWQFMQDYQKQRVLTLLNPDSDPAWRGL